MRIRSGDLSLQKACEPKIRAPRMKKVMMGYQMLIWNGGPIWDSEVEI
jgi:hypothetical protein